MDSPEPAISTATEQQPPSCYVEPADALDVMFEQLEYLVDHVAGHPNGRALEFCSECGRLQGATAWLLMPFR